MIPVGWQQRTVKDICSLHNGHGFTPQDWDTKGYPIIRIQNLNGNTKFNYYSKSPDKRWVVNPGELLFAWAGTKGVSFGPCIWGGGVGVLNQHIYKVVAKENVDKQWLFLVLKVVTDTIEKRAHGFKATLVHVQKKDIDNQAVLLPPLPEQQKIARILSTWDEAIDCVQKLLGNSRLQKKVLMQQLLTGKKRLPGFSGEWEWLKTEYVFKNYSRKGKTDLPVLSVTQDLGVVERSSLERKINMSLDNIDTYKEVQPGSFVVSLRSFQGGLEYSSLHGVVSPAYHVLQAIKPVSTDYYKYYFKSYEFIGHLAIAVIGIRDGKQISYEDFSFMRLPYPPLPEQTAIAKVLSAADAVISQYETKLASLQSQKKALMQQLLTGKKRVVVDSPQV